jgi:tetratricopeptide (TPR) repeat protein
MKRIPALIACALFVIGGGKVYGATLDWRALDEYANTIDLTRALEEAQESPESLEKMYVAGLVCLNEFKPDEARLYFERMEKFDRNSLYAQWGLAECLRREYKLFPAEYKVREVLVRDPEFFPAYVTLGYIQYLQKDFERAGATIVTVLNNQDKVNPVLLVRAHCLYAGIKGMLAHFGGPFSKSVNGAAVLRHLGIARKLQPDSPMVAFGYGSYYLLVPPILGRDPDKALVYFKGIIERCPRFADVYVRMAQAYRMKGMQQQYREYLAKALELEPRSIIALDISSGTCDFICVK